MNKVVEILMNRDGMSEEEAKELVKECRQMIYEGENPEDVLQYELGLEPDYIFDIIQEGRTAMSEDLSYEFECIRNHWSEIMFSLTSEEKARLGEMLFEVEGRMK